MDQKILFIILFLQIICVFGLDSTIKFKYADIIYEETNEVQILGINNGTLNYIIIPEQRDDSEGFFRAGVRTRYASYCEGDNACQLFTKPLKQVGIACREIIPFIEYFDPTGKNPLVNYTATTTINNGCLYNQTTEITLSDKQETLPIDGLFISTAATISVTHASSTIDNEFIEELAQIARNFPDVIIQFNAALETTPLARAEWIKFVGVFYGKEIEATQYFSAIEEAYECNRIQIAKAVDDGDFNKMKVAWLYSHYPSQPFWETTDLDYKRNLLIDAGSELIVHNETSINDLHEIFSKTHFLINDTPSTANTSDNDDMRDFYEQYGYTIKDKKELLLLKKGNILKTDGTQNTDKFSSWEEDYMAYPHLVLVDLIYWLHPKLDVNNNFSFNVNGTSNYPHYWFRNIAHEDEASAKYTNSNMECPSRIPNVLTKKVCINLDNFKGDGDLYNEFDTGFKAFTHKLKKYWFVVIIIIIIIAAAVTYFTRKQKQSRKHKDRMAGILGNDVPKSFDNKTINKHDQDGIFPDNDVKNHNFYKLDDFKAEEEDFS